MEIVKGCNTHSLPANIGDCTAEEFANGLKFMPNGDNSVAAEFVFRNNKFRGTGFNIDEAYKALLMELSALFG